MASATEQLITDSAIEQAINTNSPSEQLPECPICLYPLSNDCAILLPCAHSLDLECAKQMILTTGRGSKLCPLCRIAIEAVKYEINAENQDEFKLYTIGKWDRCEDGWVREDEWIREGMSSEEIGRVAVLRKLRTCDEWRPFIWRVAKGGVWGMKDNKFHLFRRYIELEIKQTNEPLVQSTLSRRIKLTIHLEIDPNLSFLMRKYPRSDSKIEESCKLLAEIVDKHERGNPFKEELKDVRVLRDSRNIETVVGKSIKGCVTSDGAEAEVKWMTCMKERYTAQVGEGEDRDVIDGKSRLEREEVVRLARGEIQGLLEWMKQTGAIEVKLQGEGTGILEPWDGNKCEYCEELHRNGDCELPPTGPMEGEWIGLWRWLTERVLGCILS